MFGVETEFNFCVVPEVVAAFQVEAFDIIIVPESPTATMKLFPLAEIPFKLREVPLV